ncbi:hypothetical protein Taro_046406, partial [Colocasia esculenta]|nr:hypothetical protein [Colocasia esculenta]
KADLEGVATGDWEVLEEETFGNCVLGFEDDVPSDDEDEPLSSEELESCIIFHLGNMAHQEHEEQEVEQAIDPSWAHGTLFDAQQKKSEIDYTLPINVDDDEDDDDDPDPEFTAAACASRRSYAEEDDRRRDLGTSGSHLSRDDSRRSLPRSTSGSMDTYLYRSRSVKYAGIKQALKGVNASAKAAKGAIKGIVKWFLHVGVPAHTAENPYFHSMLDAIAKAGPGLKAPTRKHAAHAILMQICHIYSLMSAQLGLYGRKPFLLLGGEKYSSIAPYATGYTRRGHGFEWEEFLEDWKEDWNRDLQEIFGGKELEALKSQRADAGVDGVSPQAVDEKGKGRM